MKRILFIILITIPFLGFSQDISGTGWKISQGNGKQLIIIFENDGTFTFLNVINKSGNEGKVYSDDVDTWMLNDGNIIISYTNGFKICSGKINDTGDFMWGTWVNEQQKSGTWSGELIKF